MNRAQVQAQLDAIAWYHEFDFGDGLKTRIDRPALPFHRRLWAFIQDQLDAIDFAGKSVLDVGCWDGFWSFSAERRGAASVLATDDFSQNWASARGIHLARELLRSRVEVHPSLSVYELSNLERTFDVVLFLGVYYHLWDPFHALAQVRHCCHPGTVVLVEGNVTTALPAGGLFLSAARPDSKFLPSFAALEEMLSAAYFRIDAHAFLPPAGPLPRVGWRWRLRMARHALKGSQPVLRRPEPDIRRVFLRCSPFSGHNALHAYRPPFGLHRYDDRFR
jgi:tRNA (mo5U34)-methyltransferase